MFRLFIILILFFSNLKSTIITVSTDSTADYLTIQEAIDSAGASDTVLVSPGTYMENLDYLGKNIMVSSHYIFDEEPVLMYNTIINGNQNGSVVKFDNDETRQAVLNGFTITNGSGTPYYSNYPNKRLKGGGIFIRNSSPAIMNCYITENRLEGNLFDSGGGICIADNSNPFLSDLIITQNFSAFNCGGISIFINANAEFDPINRCSVFLNWAGKSNDIGHGGFDPVYDIDIYLDTATVVSPSDYFIRTGPDDLLNVINGKIEQENSDLYVNPLLGNNTNSGTSINDPLKNIHYALALIEAYNQNPRTIHLAEGTYSSSLNNEFLPLNLKSYVSIKGLGKNTTILDAEGSINPVLMARDYERDYTISDMQIKNTERLEEYDTEFVFQIEQNTNLLIKNILFTQNSMNKIISNNRVSGFPTPDSTSVIVSHCDFINNTSNNDAHTHQFIMYENCRFSNNLPFYFDEGGSSGTTVLSISDHSIDASPYQYRRIEGCVFDNNMNETTEWSPPFSIVKVSDAYLTNFVNCTFVDNQIISTNGSTLILEGYWDYVRLVNCLFWGNDPQQVYIDGQLTSEKEVVFSHCLVQDSLNGISGTGNYNLNWLDGNMSIDPQFSLQDSLPYSLSEYSPAIDAGTPFFVWDGDTVINLTPADYVGSAPDIGAYEFGAGMNTIHQNQLPKPLSIGSAYPNPFNSSITIQYSLRFNENIKIKLFDINGRLVKEILSAKINAGDHSINLNDLPLSSGTYFIRIESEQHYDTKKIVYLK